MSEDLDRQERKLEIELREQKADTQRRMAWVALVSMLVFTAVLFAPFVPDQRIQLMVELSAMLYMALATVVAAYFGFTTWMGKK